MARDKNTFCTASKLVAWQNVTAEAETENNDNDTSPLKINAFPNPNNGPEPAYSIPR
jgi:hypothetical protein